MLGAFLMIEAALPAFGANGGSIIDIGSTASAVAAPQLSIYTASNCALNGLTRVLSTMGKAQADGKDLVSG